MDSIKMWEYLAKSGGKHKYEALVAVGLNRTMRNYCPLCHAVAEESKEEGIPFAENINQQCRTHCPMSLSDWYGELDDKTRSTYRRVPICETFTEGSLWQDWLNALNKHERLNAAAEMVRAFKEKARELTSELLLDLNGDYSLVSAKLVWAMKLPLKHKLEYLKEHGAELCGEDAAFALREVFGVEIGDTIRVHYLSAQSTGPHAIPGGAEKKFHDNETTATYTISAIKDGSIYINGNTRKGEGH
ncbi:MAG TPA: hypothetical protein EYP35_10600, partial [Desulfobacterales bacterium]|nr:hypothetical protein [Desulfobacterales bacterium]